MKTTYLVYKQVNGTRQLVVATRDEWIAIIKENRGLPIEKRRCFMKDCFRDEDGLDCMYIEVSTAKYREWNSENTVREKKRKAGIGYTSLSLDAGVEDTEYDSLHECVPSGVDLERLALDKVLMGELKQALKAWKPWAEELLELYMSGAKRASSTRLCEKYQLCDRAVRKRKEAFEKFVLEFLKK